jgi:hypothetical protein
MPLIEELAAESIQLIIERKQYNILEHFIVEHKDGDATAYTFLEIFMGASKQITNITDSSITVEDYGEMDKAYFLNLCA